MSERKDVSVLKSLCDDIILHFRERFWCIKQRFHLMSKYRSFSDVSKDSSFYSDIYPIMEKEKIIDQCVDKRRS